MNETQDTRFMRALTEAVDAGLISKPHRIDLPEKLPFKAAVCTLSLPAGCLAPKNKFGLRVGSGVGSDESASFYLAQAEAAERYSLQFSNTRPSSLEPIVTFGGRVEAASVSELTLGAPSPTSVLSRGSAIGITFEDAASRACLEKLEHFHVKQDGRLIGGFDHVCAASVPELAELTYFLNEQLRELDVHLLSSQFGYFVAHATCRDRDGGRQTFGSAASLSREDSIVRACQEAVLLWRNMIEMERSAVAVDSLQTEHANQFFVYRGAEPFALQLQVGRLSFSELTLCDRTMAEILNLVTNSRVRIFDMTVAELKLPVARAVLG